MILWLDDLRLPPEPVMGQAWQWVKTYRDAVELLETGQVDFASLDHDLGDYTSERGHEKTGYDVLCWMEEHNVWPSQGVRIHTGNSVGKQKMLLVVDRVYGRTFQLQIPGSHRV